MNWVKITNKDLEYALNKPQLETLKAEALRSPEHDIAFEVISNVTSRVRAEIATSGLYTLDADHSKIPQELKEAAIRLCVEALQLRLPSMEFSQTQARQADLARELLLRVAQGTFSISRPIFGIKTGTSKKGFFASTSKRNITRKTTNGI